MRFQWQAAICKTPIFLLVFVNTQLLPGLAATNLTTLDLLQKSKDDSSTPPYQGENKSFNPASPLDKGKGGLRGVNSTYARSLFSLRSIAKNQALGSESRSVALRENQQSSQSLCTAQLGTAIDAVINRPQLHKAHWGILIEPLSSDDALYRHDAEHYFMPASNAKLLTTAAALRRLGSDFRIRTSIYDTGAGSLRVVGRGDPSLTDTQLRELAQQLKRQGIGNVPQLIIDNGYFQGEPVNLTWDWEDVQSDYGTSVSSLILNQNAVELTLSPQQPGQRLRISWSDAIAAKQWQIENHSITEKAAVPSFVAVNAVLGQPLLRIQGHLAVNAEPEVFGLAILNPAEHFLQHFQRVLAAEGINVGRVSVGLNVTTASERELAAVESPPLSVLLVETNQESNNLYAEVLLRTLGAGASGDTAEVGLKTMKDTLTTLGINPESYVLVDGSGLSHQNLVSPEAIAQTLKRMAQTKEAAVYRASLPVAGVSGTLRHRFNNTAAQGTLQAKTGTLTGVSALSGYLNVPEYQPLVFSIIVNQSDQSAETLRQAIDEIVLLLTRLRSC